MSMYETLILVSWYRRYRTGTPPPDLTLSTRNCMINNFIAIASLLTIKCKCNYIQLEDDYVKSYMLITALLIEKTKFKVFLYGRQIS